MPAARYHHHEGDFIVERKLHGLRAENFGDGCVRTAFGGVLLCVCRSLLVVINTFCLDDSFGSLDSSSGGVLANAGLVGQNESIGAFERCA